MASDKGKKSAEEDRLEWVDTISKLDEARINKQDFRNKLVRKIKENPFVPIGIAATVTALSFGLLAMKSGNKHRSQLMMRARVGAQGFTIIALLVGVALAARQKP